MTRATGVLRVVLVALAFMALQPEPARADGCTEYNACVNSCPLDLDLACAQQRPGCDPRAESDCTTWFDTCFGDFDSRLKCSYNNGGGTV